MVLHRVGEEMVMRVAVVDMEAQEINLLLLRQHLGQAMSRSLVARDMDTTLPRRRDKDFPVALRLVEEAPGYRMVLEVPGTRQMHWCWLVRIWKAMVGLHLLELVARVNMVLVLPHLWQQHLWAGLTDLARARSFTSFWKKLLRYNSWDFDQTYAKLQWHITFQLQGSVS
jgi:hypothetical protein